MWQVNPGETDAGIAPEMEEDTDDSDDDSDVSEYVDMPEANEELMCGQQVCV